MKKNSFPWSVMANLSFHYNFKKNTSSETILLPRNWLLHTNKICTCSNFGVDNSAKQRNIYRFTVISDSTCCEHVISSITTLYLNSPEVLSRHYYYSPPVFLWHLLIHFHPTHSFLPVLANICIAAGVEQIEERS